MNKPILNLHYKLKNLSKSLPNEKTNKTNLIGED